jgi:hypothetical protein
MVIKLSYSSVRFQVLKAASMNMTVFWDAAPRSLAEIYRCFRDSCCHHHTSDDTLIALIMETVNAPETSINYRLEYATSQKAIIFKFL